MDVPSHEQLIGTIDAFLKRHPAVGEARFGRDATGEPGLIDRLRKGSSPTLKSLHRMKNYMQAKDAELAAAGAVPVHSSGDTGAKVQAQPNNARENIGAVA